MRADHAESRCSDHGSGHLARRDALDRVLLQSYYVIPNWHLSYFRVAAWDKFSRPKISPPYTLALDAWWVDPQREQTVEAKKAQEPKQ